MKIRDCHSIAALKRPKVTRSRHKGALTLAAVVSAVLVLSGCGRTSNSAEAAAGDGHAPPAVSVVTLEQQNIQQWDQFNGRVAAVDLVELRPRVSGYIERISFTEGQEVRKGQVLFVIDQRPYKAALSSAQAQLQRGRAAADLAKSLDDRAKDLMTHNAMSLEEADTRRAGLAQATANVLAAEADVAAAALNLEFTEVKAPTSGRASKANLTVGNLAQADQSTLTTIASQDPVYIDFDADEHTYLRYNAAGRKTATNGAERVVKVGLANETDFPHQGVLSFTDNKLDPSTGTIRVRAVLRNPDRLFTPGMFARVQLQGLSSMPAILIDDKAVLTDQSRQYVYVVGEGNKAERRDLKLGKMFEGKRVVLDGLQSGDRLVVAGLQRIYYPGMPIDPQAQNAEAQPDVVASAKPADAASAAKN